MPAILEISQLGQSVLREIASPVADPRDPRIVGLAENMLETLAASGGVGIAAPQVGESLRIIVVASRPGERYPQAPLMEPLVMVNPELLEASAETETGWEGCLSIPGMRGRVVRHRAVRVRFSNLAGEVHELALEGFPARVFQHELDHLDGLVFLDRVSDSRQLVTEREYQRLMGA